MTRSTLQAWLLADKGFQTSLRQLEVSVVRRQFPQLIQFESEYELKPDWPYLLFCASTLAPSDVPAAEEAALRIAQSAVVDQTTLASERDAALVVLDSLSNRRAISLAIDRGHVFEGLERRLGAIQSIDWLRRKLENRIDLVGGGSLTGSRFQRRFWQAADQHGWLSVSAPTSAGKSFILGQWIADRFASKDFSRIVYIAPTRALVQQVDSDLRGILRESGIEGVELKSLPMGSAKDRASREMLVFTQERLHYYIQRYGPGGIDALVVDEAHKVGDDARGILLQDVIEQVAAANPDLRVIFTSPLTENPELLLSDAPEGTAKAPLLSGEATVNQNLLWIERAADDPRGWLLNLRKDNRSLPLGRFQTKTRLSQIQDKMATFAILTDTGDGGVLVYANGAAVAERYAAAIAAKLDPVPQTPEMLALDALCEDTIHKDYKLREGLLKGVAFHYGNMPLLLRTAIEDLFRLGHIRYLVCTSTLVEGVNLPCRTIVVRAPRKGKKERMSPADFWNLAGRAGRWGKEFQGNVVCVDTDDLEAWGATLPRQRSTYRIERTTDRLLGDEEALVSYIRAGASSEDAKKAPALEAAVSYLATVRDTYGSLLVAPWHTRINRSRLERVDAELAFALSAFDPVPPEWLRRHAGISPFAMQRMTRAWLNLADEKVRLFVPIEPEDTAATDQYTRIFGLLGHHMTTVFGAGARCQSLGILTTNWMMGYPIKRLISDRDKNLRKRGIDVPLANTIRKTLEDVEQIARFQAPRYLACYSDIARYALNMRGKSEIATNIPDLTLQLEFGVRGPVQLGLMSLGLSRSSTLAVTDAVSRQLALELEPNIPLEASSIINAVLSLPLGELGLGAIIFDEMERFQSLFKSQGV